MINEVLFEKIKNAVINIDDKDYIKVKKDILKSLKYHYNIFTKKWKRTKFDGMVASFEFKTAKQDKSTYLIEVDLEKLNKPFAKWFVVPLVIELIEVGD